MCKPRQGPSADLKSAGTLILELPAYRPVRKLFAVSAIQSIVFCYSSSNKDTDSFSLPDTLMSECSRIYPWPSLSTLTLQHPPPLLFLSHPVSCFRYQIYISIPNPFLNPILEHPVIYLIAPSGVQ